MNSDIQEKEKVNSNTKYIVIIICLVVLVLGLVGYIIFGKNEGKQENSNGNNEVVAKEEEITDEAIINSLNERIALLEKMGDDGYHGPAVMYSKNKVTSESISRNVKFLALISNLKHADLTYGDLRTAPGFDEVYKDMALGSMGFDENALDTEKFVGDDFGMAVYNKADIENEYKKVFADELNYENAASATCPALEVLGNYVLVVYNCGGAGYPVDYGYSYKYTYAGNKYYVYRANHTVTNQDPEWGTDFKVDKDNYNNYDKYKLTFVKEDGYYKFVQSEKI